MKRASIIIAALLTSLTQAAPPPEPASPKPMAPNSSRPSWMSGDRNALSPPLRFPYESQRTHQPSVWPSLYHRVERDLDRSMWRLEDSATYELNRLELERAANRFYTNPADRAAIERELFEYERDRQITQDNIRRAEEKAMTREQLMSRREYELWLNDGLRTAVGEQATRDKLALQAAREKRDADLNTASTARDEALRGARDARDANARSTIQRDFETRRTTIEQSYQAERARILGVEPK